MDLDFVSVHKNAKRELDVCINESSRGEFHIKSCRLALGLPAPLWIVKPGFHIVVSVVLVVSVVRKKFIGQIEFILSRTKSCICRFFCIEHLYIFYLSYEFLS